LHHPSSLFSPPSLPPSLQDTIRPGSDFFAGWIKGVFGKEGGVVSLVLEEGRDLLAEVLLGLEGEGREGGREDRREGGVSEREA